MNITELNAAVAELEALEKAATPGEWSTLIGSGLTEINCAEKAPVVNWSGFDDSFRPKKKHAANAAFIAAARNLLPHLLEERRLLREALVKLAAADEGGEASQEFYEAKELARKALGLEE